MKKKNKAQHRPQHAKGPAHARGKGVAAVSALGRTTPAAWATPYLTSLEPEPPGLTAAGPGAGTSGTTGLVLGLTASPLDSQDSRKRGSCTFCPQGPGGREQQLLRAAPTRVPVAL